VNAEQTRMGIGVIVNVRDFKGLVSAALSFTREAYPEPVTAESMGTLCAVEFCRMQDIIFEGMLMWWSRL
jgi:hypothetical protein